MDKNMYYYLKEDEVIQSGDEWTVDGLRGLWYSCTGEVIGYTVKSWDDERHCEQGWQVRRKIIKTKLGNIL